MNNLFREKKKILKKINYSSNLELSATSQDFLTDINDNNIKGGFVNTNEILNNFINNNLATAFTMIEKFCNFLKCHETDGNGNTILHHLVYNCNKSNCIDVIKKILNKDDVHTFINKQNNEGKTAILIATMNGYNEIAYLL